jgi:sulfur carrier protein
VRITVNGERTDAGSLPEVLGALVGTEEPAGVAVAVNAEVVPRHRWAGHALADGDVVEVVQAVQGG